MVGVFSDPIALTRDDSHPRETRFVTMGRDSLDRVVVVSWLWRGENVRLVSARRPTASERRQYTEGLADA